MANIKVTIDYPIANGLPLTFKSPAKCSQVTGMTVHYTEGGASKSKTFQFADAHGNNVGSIDLFASNVLVKVILDVDASKAYVQNADTNAYLESELAKKYSPDNKPTPEALGMINWFKKGTPIESGDDLNSEKYMALGKYYAQSTAVVKTLINCPAGLTDDNFVMYVFQRTNESDTLCQLILTLKGEICLRGSNSNGVFGSWKKMFTNADKPYGSYTGSSSVTTPITIDTGVTSEHNNAVLIRKSGGTSFVIATASGFIGKDASDNVCAGTGVSYGGTSGKITIMTVDDMFNTDGATYRWYCL